MYIWLTFQSNLNQPCNLHVGYHTTYTTVFNQSDYASRRHRHMWFHSYGIFQGIFPSLPIPMSLQTAAMRRTGFFCTLTVSIFHRWSSKQGGRIRICDRHRLRLCVWELFIEIELCYHRPQTRQLLLDTEFQVTLNGILRFPPQPLTARTMRTTLGCLIINVTRS